MILRASGPEFSQEKAAGVRPLASAADFHQRGADMLTDIELLAIVFVAVVPVLLMLIAVEWRL